MSSSHDQDAAEHAEGFLTRFRDWWLHNDSLGTLPKAELGRIASELGMTDGELADLATKGPHAADLLRERMGVLGLTRTDVDRFASGLMRDLEKNCAYCRDKGGCKKDLVARPEDPVWHTYCPNAVTLESMAKAKG